MTVDVLLNSDRSIIRLGHTCAEESDATTGAESKRNFFPVKRFFATCCCFCELCMNFYRAMLCTCGEPVSVTSLCSTKTATPHDIIETQVF